MINRIKSDKIYCGLDIGSRTVKACLVRYNDQQHPELLGVYEIKTSGFKNASVSDLSELTECIQNTIGGLLLKTGVKLKEVQLGIGGELIIKRFSSAVIPLMDKGSKIITYNDIRKVQTQARLLGTNMEEEILHDISQFYNVDDVNISLNPIGLFGRKLEVKTLLILANLTLLKNITKAVNQAGYEVANLFFTSYVSSQVVLEEKIKKEGSILIDVGSNITDILIFKDGLLKYLDTIYIGGDEFTNKIAESLEINFDLAEEIKKSYAVAINADDKSDEEILVKKEDGYIPVKRGIVCQSIEPVISKLSNQIMESVRSSNLYEQVNSGIVMVGGGSLLPGLLERIEQNTKLPVRMGKLNLSAKNLNNVVMYSSVIGLAQGGNDKFFGLQSVIKEQSAGFVNMICNRVKEVYQEYF